MPGPLWYRPVMARFSGAEAAFVCIVPFSAKTIYI
jgi:hypothetical protein